MAMGVLKQSRAGGRSSRRAPMAEINVTPFVDVMLVLLIIFMVTAPLLTAGVPVQLPQSKAGALKQDQEPVTVSIERDGRISIGEEQVAPEALSERFRLTMEEQDHVPEGLTFKLPRELVA